MGSNLSTENGKRQTENGPGDDSRCPCRVCGADRYRPVYYLDEVEIVVCRECGLLQISSQRHLKDLKTYYTRQSAASRSFTPGFDQRKIVRGSRFRARFLQKHTGLTTGKVLEIGSSGGHFLAVLKKRGFQVLGVEPSPLGAEQHREKGIPVINDLLEYADLAPGQFDAVCLFQVFEHFENPREIAAKLHALLRPGGFLLLEIPDIHSTGAKFEKRPHRLFNKEHLTYFSRESLTALMEQVGFNCVAACHYDYDAWRIPFSKSLRKIMVPLVNPGFKGPLEKIMRLEMKIQHHFLPASAVDKPETSSYAKSARSRFKTLRKMLTAPLDILCGYLAYRLDRGASLCWLGRKTG